MSDFFSAPSASLRDLPPLTRSIPSLTSRTNPFYENQETQSVKAGLILRELQPTMSLLLL
ncbi:MAG TPA: hypothetical protein DCE44_09265 [Verrucomicrobiales bacterium]|nr:hypothetical protein [Verrucomicrobiales bacterium]